MMAIIRVIVSRKVLTGSGITSLKFCHKIRVFKREEIKENNLTWKTPLVKNFDYIYNVQD